LDIFCGGFILLLEKNTVSQQQKQRASHNQAYAHQVEAAYSADTQLCTR